MLPTGLDSQLDYKMVRHVYLTATLAADLAVLLATSAAGGAGLGGCRWGGGQARAGELAVPTGFSAAPQAPAGCRLGSEDNLRSPLSHPPSPPARVQAAT